MPFYVFAWIATILFGFVTVLGKLTSKYSIANPWLFNFGYLLFLLLFTLPIALVNHVGVPAYWGNLTAASFCLVIAFTLYSLALYQLDVSVISPLYNLRIAFSLLFGVFLLGEVLSVFQFILVVVMFSAGLFITMDEKMSLRSFFRKPVLIVIISTFFLSLMYVFLKKSVAEIGYWNFTLWSLILAQIMLLITIPFFKKDIGTISKKQVGALLILSFLDALGTLANNRAFEVNISRSAAILAVPSGMILVYILSAFKPKLLEKHSLKIYALRFSAAAVMILVGLKLSS